MRLYSGEDNVNGWPDVGSGAFGVARGVHLEVLPGRIGGCSDDADRILAGLRAVQLLDWQSPAGRAYRSRVEDQCRSLWLAGQALQAARAAVTRHVEAVAGQELRGGVQWWS